MSMSPLSSPIPIRIHRPRRRSRRAALAAWLAVAGLALLAGPVVPDVDTLDVGSAATDSSDIAATITLPGPGDRQVLPAVQHPFSAGEQLKFSVSYGPIGAGTAWLEVPEVREWNGHTVFTLVARAESNAFVSTFYKVRNRIESFWDPDGRFSRRYFENRREGGYKVQREILFDAERREARYSDGNVFPIPPHVQDALSSFYYTRFQELPLGGSIVFDYHASRKNQPLQVKVLGRERVRTPAGTFDCVAIEPLLKAGGIFKNKGRLVIWITDDERRMPVRMRSAVTIGSISVTLQKYRAGA